MNIVTLGGRLGHNIELKRNGEFAFVNTQIAVTQEFKNKDGEYGTDWINIQASGKTAELLFTHFKKGDYLAVQAKWRHRTWTDNNQNTRHADHAAISQILWDACKINKENQTQNTTSNYTQNNNFSNKQTTNTFNDPFTNSGIVISDEDIPF